MEQILKSRYRIGEKISENPFSLTYRGFLIGTDKPVIVKIYKRGTLNSALISSMKQRVREFSLIGHHGIAKLLDGDYGWQGFYYVREFVEGRNLQEVLGKEKKIDAEKACAVAGQILEVLEQTHARGIIHGALKPNNIFVDSQGFIKLTDFVIEGEVKESMPQKVVEIMENARYASPEGIAGQPVTPAADLFSLGLILYEMVSGGTALTGGLAGNIQKLKLLPSLLKQEFSSLPRYLEEIISKAVQKDPRLRFATAREFRESLEGKNLVRKTSGDGEYLKIFESAVTQYGGEEIDKESEALQDVGRLQLRWSKEKHRTWILSAVVGLAVVLGILYAFFFGR